MKIIAYRNLACYRLHTPKWAIAPMSGAGAATQGGRANRKGLEALYLSLEPATAVAEFQQGSPFLPPGLLVSYSLTLDLVLYTDQLPAHGSITVNDPRGDLPKDQSSWHRPKS
ncbi:MULTISPECIES: RES family NAD+ phosphorylase [Pseudomonas]|jgi:hypothetical protein|uniref:RES family NAD+ phosphorylase n=1 Tax=Pseudomonas TaxID=286 RepID=UPI002093C1FC|nr:MULTISPECIES: RES family NAD+ phosphorylase [Pseudomonas]USS56708.1 RES family NAD+ phosphorylase [Pseudomonas kermanshahensis]UVL67608.1 RES family NAD+ phosphorylase [Pseudomonas sp. B21-031]